MDRLTTASFWGSALWTLGRVKPSVHVACACERKRTSLPLRCHALEKDPIYPHLHHPSEIAKQHHVTHVTSKNQTTKGQAIATATHQATKLSCQGVSVLAPAPPARLKGNQAVERCKGEHVCSTRIYISRICDRLQYWPCLCLLVSCLDFSQLKLRTYPKNKAG